MFSFFLEYSLGQQQVHFRTFPVSLFFRIKINKSGGGYMVGNVDNKFKFSKVLSVYKS